MSGEIQIHPYANCFPRMGEKEFKSFADDIAANGLREPITLFQGMILEGRHRYSACTMHGVELRYEHFAGDEKAALAFVASKNLHRRHLTAQGKRDAIAALIKAQPEKSDRTIAEQIKVGKDTVRRIRKKAESTGAVAPVKKRVGKDGKARKQPARRASKASKAKAILAASASAKAQPDPRATVDEVRDPEKFKQQELPIGDPAASAEARKAVSAETEDHAAAQLALLREFAALVINRAKSVTFDPKDHGKWKTLRDQVKLILS
jgi:hypothetical protein